MKIFQVLGGFCHWDATNTVKNIDATAGRYAPDVVFVETPDFVFEGWGYDETADGDARFIQPTPPEGWLYDPDTGTFYEENSYPPGKAPDVWDELAAAYAQGVNEA